MHVSSADLLSLNKGKEQQTTQNTFLYFSVAPHNVTLFIELLNMSRDESHKSLNQMEGAKSQDTIRLP